MHCKFGLWVGLAAAFVSTGCLKGKTTAGQKDPLLGKWVCLADNVHERPTATLVFSPNGIATFTDEGESLSLRFKRESMSAWLARLPKESQQVFKDWDRPGAERIYFADEQGKFMEWGGSVLQFDPAEQILSNPLTQLWCREGDEARVRRLSGMDAEAAKAKQAQKKREAWRPKLDLTPRWKLLWQVIIPMAERARPNLTVSDLERSGRQQALVSLHNGLWILDIDKRTSGKAQGQSDAVRKVEMAEQPSGAAAIARLNGQTFVAKFTTWGDSVTFYDLGGKKVFVYGTAEKGIDWATPIRLDGETTEVAISYNGGGGVDLVGSDGKARWHAPVDANCYNVAAVRTSKAPPESVLAVDGDGAVLFDTRGKMVKHFKEEQVGCVGAGDVDGDGIDEVFTLGTWVSSGERLSVFKLNGQKLWSQKASDVDYGFVEGDPFVVGTFGGRRLIGVANAGAIRFFRPNGELAGDMLVPGIIHSLDVAHRPSGDLLLVLVHGELRCFAWAG